MAGRSDVPELVLRCDGRQHDLVVGDRTAAPTVTGVALDLAAWLIGRSPGAALTVSPDGPLPTPPEWI
ncbi:DinB family protein [Salinispora arenicola]|uniref:hypothetical protein n=1 Tax=Salinispora arenicola TaxID=168697 RepID=UPI0036F27077